MWNLPTKKELSSIPELYQTEQVSLANKVIHMHFYIGGCDWYVAEFDGEDLFFGYAILNNDMENAEWGYFSLSELQSIHVSGIEIDRDIYWEPIPASRIEKLKGWL